MNSGNVSRSDLTTATKRGCDHVIAYCMRVVNRNMLGAAVGIMLESLLLLYRVEQSVLWHVPANACCPSLKRATSGLSSPTSASLMQFAQFGIQNPTGEVEAVCLYMVDCGEAKSMQNVTYLTCLQPQLLTKLDCLPRWGPMHAAKCPGIRRRDLPKSPGCAYLISMCDDTNVWFATFIPTNTITGHFHQPLPPLQGTHHPVPPAFQRVRSRNQIHPAASRRQPDLQHHRRHLQWLRGQGQCRVRG